MIRRIQARNYCCLRYVDVSLDRFHVLVGPNASGKSTLLDIVAFLGDMVSGGLEAAVEKRTRNFQDLVWRRPATQLGFELAVEFDIPDDVEAQLPRKKDFELFRYEVAIREDEDGIRIDSERGLLMPREDDRPRQEVLEFPAPLDGPGTILLGGGRPGARTILSKSREARDNFNVEVSEKAGKGWAISISFGPDRSTLGNLPESPERFPVSTRVKRLLENGLQRLFLDSAQMRRPSPPTRRREGFAPNGSNLPRVIRQLREENEYVFEDWLAHVRAALPEIDDIRVVEREDDRHCYLMLRYGTSAQIHKASGRGSEMNAIEVPIDGERLIADLKRLREFGAFGTGVVRTSLSPIDIESRHWLCARLEDAGLDARIDGAGNVFGRSRNTAKAVIIGSHTDTQPTGGWLDGAMGVIYGLEVARALSQAPATKDRAVDVASWLDEEGRFCGCFGSLSFVDEAPAHALDSIDSTDGTGLALRDALREAGLEGVAQERLDPERHIAYLEAHIEQGPYLEEEGNRIGVVTSIVGSRNFTVEFEGEQNHAGTTPMSRRRDAAHAMTEFAHAVYREFPAAAGERSVWTIGEMVLEPNAVSIVPGKARLNLQFRDQDPAVLDRLESLARNLLARANGGPCDAVMHARKHHSVPAPMDAHLRSHLERAAERHAPGRWTSMPSAAVHDAQILARHLPSAMLFVPSINGVSHAFEEDTGEEDIVLGCQVLATATASVLAASG